MKPETILQNVSRDELVNLARTSDIPHAGRRKETLARDLGAKVRMDRLLQAMGVTSLKDILFYCDERTSGSKALLIGRILPLVDKVKLKAAARDQCDLCPYLGPLKAFETHHMIPKPYRHLFGEEEAFQTMRLCSNCHSVITHLLNTRLPQVVNPDDSPSKQRSKIKGVIKRAIAETKAQSRKARPRR